VRILTVNAGSSSLKLRLLGDGDEPLASADLPAFAGRAEERELERAIAAMPAAGAVGHRIVHGGTRFRGPTRLDAEAIEALRELTPLAPLHQPAALEAVAAVGALLPELPAVACIDTAFHAALPAAASTYALPREWREPGDRRRASDDTEYALTSRLVDLDPLEQRVTRQIRAFMWRDGELVAEEEHEITLTLYFTGELVLLLEAAGFVDVEVHGGHERRPPTRDDDFVGLVARKP